MAKTQFGPGRRWNGIVHGCLLCSAVWLAFAARAEAVFLNFTFTARWNDQANWPGATQAEREANRNIASLNVFQASQNWAQSITSPFVVAVEVDWNTPMAFFNDNDLDVCGVGGVLTTQNIFGSEKPATAKIIMNQLQANNFFFDPTPAVHEEFVNVNGHPWQGQAHPNGPAAGKTDFLSCVKHEFGHTLGFHRDAAGNPFGPWIAETADGDVDLTDFPLSIPVGLPLNNYNAASHFRPNVALPDLNVPPFGLVTNISTNDLLMHPELANGHRVSMSPFDISAAARVLGLANNNGYNLLGKNMMIPEPASLALLALGAGCLLGRRSAR